jgi:Outer membrane protein beta-barrel domain
MIRIIYMRNKMLIIAIIPMFIAAISTASGQRMIHLGIGAGIAIPAGTFRDTYTPRENVLITVAAGPQTSPFGVRLDYSYNEFGGKSVLGKPSQGTHLNIVTANLIAVLPFGMVKPYLVGGGGLYRFQEAADTSLTTKNDFGSNIGIGCTFPFLSNAGFIEARYHRIYGRTVSEQLVPVTVGIMF